MKNFELVYVPEPAVFHNFTRTENNEIHVFWTVRSKQKLVEVTLHYKRDDKHVSDLCLILIHPLIINYLVISLISVQNMDERYKYNNQ